MNRPAWFNSFRRGVARAGVSVTDLQTLTDVLRATFFPGNRIYFVHAGMSETERQSLAEDYARLNPIGADAVRFVVPDATTKMRLIPFLPEGAIVVVPGAIISTPAGREIQLAAVFMFPIPHAVMEAIFDVALGRQKLGAGVPRMIDCLEWGVIFAVPFALTAIFGMSLPFFDFAGVSLSLVTLGVSLVHALKNVMADHSTRADALADAKRTVAILRGEYSGLNPADIPLLSSSVNDVFTPAIAGEMSRRLQNDFDYRHAFDRVFTAEWARAGFGTIRPRVAPAL